MSTDRSPQPPRLRKSNAPRRQRLLCEPLEDRICLSSGPVRATTLVPAVPPPPTITSPAITCTTARGITVTGTKVQGERILLNGRPVSGRRGTAWRARVPLRNIGTYTLNFYAQTAPNPLGLSRPVTLTVSRARPGGCINVGS